MKSSLLTSEQIERIHTHSLDILANVGVAIPHQELCATLLDLGARTVRPAGGSDSSFGTVLLIPPELVEKALGSATKEFVIYGRDSAFEARFGLGSRNYNTIAGEALWLNRLGGKRRYTTLEDVKAAARFAHRLDRINVVGAMADPREIPIGYRCVAVFAELVKHTTKPVTFWFHDRRSAAGILEICRVLRGTDSAVEERPICYPLLEPISPLRFPHDGIDLLYETAKVNMPVHIGPMAQMGMSAPMSVAGTMAMENAEILAGVVVTQAIRPGLPVCYGGICHAFDMATTQMIFAGPEQVLLSVGMTELGKSYGLPVYVNTGLTDAKRPDAQAGMEIASTLLASASAGADIFGHLGICGVDQASNLDMLILQHEVIEYVERVIAGVSFDADALDLELVRQAGPGGSFLESDHTLRRFREELMPAGLLDRRFYQAWLDDGGTSFEERCAERRLAVEAAAETAGAPPISDPEAAEIDGIVASYREGCL